MPNEQTKLSDLDVARQEAFAMRRDNVSLQAKLIDAEFQLFHFTLQRAYGNPGEILQVGPDGSITRIPKVTEPSPPTEVPPLAAVP